MQCSRLTRKGVPCPHHADRQREGAFFCHVHDPYGVYQMQLQDKRQRTHERRMVAGVTVRRR